MATRARPLGAPNPFTKREWVRDTDGRTYIRTTGLARPFLELAKQRRNDADAKKRQHKEGFRNFGIIPPQFIEYLINSGQMPRNYASPEGVHRMVQLLKRREYSGFRSYEGRV